MTAGKLTWLIAGVYQGRWSLEGGVAVHRGSGAEGILNFLVQLVQLHQQQHHWVQSSMLTLNKERNIWEKKWLPLHWANEDIL